MGHKWGQSRGEEEPGRGSIGEAIKAILHAVHTLIGNKNEKDQESLFLSTARWNKGHSPGKQN